MSSPSHRPPLRDEIDLWAVIETLWLGKKIILTVMLIFFLMGCLSLTVITPAWTSTAVIAPPEWGQLSNYPDAVSLSESFDPLTKSRDLPIHVWERYLAKGEALVVARNAGVSIRITPVKNRQGVTFSATASTADLAQRQLRDFLAQLNTQIQTELYAAVSMALDNRQQQLQQRLRIQDASADEQRLRQVARLEGARRVAEALSISVNQLHPVPAALSDETLFMLGMPALTALIGQAQVSPRVFDEAYYRDKAWLALIASFSLEKGGFQAVSTLSGPSLPANKDSPKTPLILMLSLLMGGIIGGGLVLLRHGWRLKSKRPVRYTIKDR